ncbi:Tyrosine-protein kinase JAK1 [Rhizoctonia solani]|uniref:Tyrosine-protein kinase JAK1 n=1 Tax=Rhizoctonia solani TaxID=456999 RepID=A0A0K6FUT5_9AGAM|nr:Tyrosine-protein kinase JAK1 [Rhizoctonia solani]
MDIRPKPVIPTGNCTQQYRDSLNSAEKHPSFDRSSFRAVPVFVSHPPPIRPSSAADFARPPSPYPNIDIFSNTNSRRRHTSPIRPASSSSVTRRNSQGGHSMRSNLPPPSASKRGYSFSREQPRKPMLASGQVIPPMRTNSCPPDANILHRQSVRANLEFDLNCGKHEDRTPINKTNAPENALLSDLVTGPEMGPYTPELVEQEAEKQWNKHRTPVTHSHYTAFQQKIEGGVGTKDDSLIDKEWRDMWKNTSNGWTEPEARWRKEVPHRRSASRNDGPQSHTVQSDSRNASVGDDDKVMNAILSHFEKEMEKRRQRAERKRLEEFEQAERKQREEENDIWRATLERESDSRRSSGQGIPKNFSTENTWLPDRLLRSDLSHIRSSSVIVEPRPSFQCPGLGSIAAIVDPLTADTNVGSLPTTSGPPVVEHARTGRGFCSREPKETFEATPEAGSTQVRSEKQRNEEIRKNYLNSARQQLYAPSSYLPLRHSQLERDPHSRDTFSREASSLEREQAAPTRRAQGLRAVESVESPDPLRLPALASVEQAYEQGRDGNIEPKDIDSKEAQTKHQEVRRHLDERDVFQMTQEQPRKTKQQSIVTELNRRPEPAVVAEPRLGISIPLPGEPFNGYKSTEYASDMYVLDKMGAETLSSWTPVRSPTSAPKKIRMPAKSRTPSQSPVNVAGAHVFTPSVTREPPLVDELISPTRGPISPLSPSDTRSMPSRSNSRHEVKLNGANVEQSRLRSMPSRSVPRINTSTPPVSVTHGQGSRSTSAKTPPTAFFDSNRASSVLETKRKRSSTPPTPWAYVNPNQAQVRPSAAPIGASVRTASPIGRKVGSSSPVAMRTFDRVGGKQRKKMEFRTQEELQTTEELLVPEQRHVKQERSIHEGQLTGKNYGPEPIERQERGVRARHEYEERKRRWASGVPRERGSRAQKSTGESSNWGVLDAWNSYEFLWSALCVASSTQPIEFRDIPWPLLRVPTGPESITPYSVGEFILSPSHSQDKTREERLHNAMLRWRSDKFELRWMSRIEEGERSKVKEAVDRVCTSLDILMGGEFLDKPIRGFTPALQTSDHVSFNVPPDVTQERDYSCCATFDSSESSSSISGSLDEYTDNDEPSPPMRVQSPQLDSRGHHSTKPRLIDDSDLGRKIDPHRVSKFQGVKPEAIGRQTPVSVVVSHLVRHGCSDLSNIIDRTTVSDYAISKGGFSDVHSAHLQNGTQVAVKILRISINSLAETPKNLKNSTQHTARELHTWSKCEHPNVLPLLGFAVFRSGIGMVSPWMKQGTLPLYLERTPGADRCDLCVQICDGLSYLHRIGIIHADLKGANVLVSDRGAPVLADFGNSLHLDQSMRFTQTTSNKPWTMRWSAPELIKESGEHSRAADVYALGMTIYEVMSGTIPYKGKSEHHIVFLVMGKWEPPERPRGIPTGRKDGDKLWGLLSRCWSLEPETRPGASEVAADMRTISSYGLRPVGGSC